MDGYHSDYTLKIQGVGMLSQEKAFDDRDEWRLLTDKLSLVPGITDTGRLGFVLQLKFRQVPGHYPDSAHDLDRLVRNAMDVRKTVEQLTASGIRAHCVAQGGVNLTSPAGKMTMQVISTVAELEKDLLLRTTSHGDHG